MAWALERAVSIAGVPRAVRSSPAREPAWARPFSPARSSHRCGHEGRQRPCPQAVAHRHGATAGRPWPADDVLLARAARRVPRRGDPGAGSRRPPHRTWRPHRWAGRSTARRSPSVWSVTDGLRRSDRRRGRRPARTARGRLGPSGDWPATLGLPLVIAASPGLGTINHTLLTLEAARRAGLTVAAVVLTPWPASPSVLEISNRDTIASLGDVAVTTLDHIARPDVDALARAGDRLPIDAWLDHPRLSGGENLPIPWEEWVSLAPHLAR